MGYVRYRSIWASLGLRIRADQDNDRLSRHSVQIRVDMQGSAVRGGL